MLACKRIFLVGFIYLCTVFCSHDVSAAKTDDVINHIIREKGKVVMGVIVDIKDKDNVDASETADMMADKLLENLIKNNPRDKYIFVDRKRLKEIMEEQKLISSGITDASTFKLGKLAGIDIIILVVFYPASVTMKTLSIETGEILDVKTQDIDIPRPVQPQMLLNEAINVKAGGYVYYPFDFNSPCTLDITIKVNIYDICIYIVDEENLSRLKAKNAFYAFASRDKITSTNFKVNIPTAGRYNIVVWNGHAMFYSKNVSIKVIAQPILR